MAKTEPVKDWTNDYDIFDDGFVADPYPEWDALRQGGCPVAHTDRWGGSHMPVTFETVNEIAHDTERFSSFEVSVAPVSASYDEDGNRQRSVIVSDDPEHNRERRLMLPFFGPKAVERYQEGTRSLCRRLVQGFIEDGFVDGAGDYARKIPPRIIADILGIDPERSDDFTEWVQGVLEIGLTDPIVREKYRTILNEFFEAEINKRRQQPGDDLISVLLAAEIDDEPLPHHVIMGNVNLMLIAGIDTTWSSIGSALWHLSTHQEDRQRLIDEPELIPMAVEEFLRAYAPVTMARLATEDSVVGGHHIEAGDRVLLTFPAANRDPEAFDDPEHVIIDRAVNRHVAFGVGPHRCLGSNLARMEMVIAIEEFLAKIPEFECRTPSEVTWAGGQVRGPRYLPLHFPATGV